MTHSFFKGEFDRKLSIHQVAYKVIAAWIAIALFYLFRDYLKEVFFHGRQTIESDFFPALLSNTRFALLLFAGMFVLTVAAVFSENVFLMRGFPAYLLTCSFLLLIHQKGFYVQGFVAIFWAAIPLYWLACSHEGSPAAQAGVSNVFKLCISLVFLGGALGKLNANYWNGEVFAHLNFPRFTESATLVSLFAKGAIIGEGVIALCYFVRDRYSFLISGSLILMMWLITDYSIINAIGPLLGLAMAGILLQNEGLFLKFNTKGKAIGLCVGLFAAVLVLEPVAKINLELARRICHRIG